MYLRGMRLAALVLTLAVSAPGCGNSSSSVAFGTITVTSLTNVNTNMANMFGIQPEPFILTGGDFSTHVGQQVAVWFYIKDETNPNLNGEALFEGGSTSRDHVLGTVTSATTIEGWTPPVSNPNCLLVEDIDVCVEVVLPSGVRGLSPTFEDFFKVPLAGNNATIDITTAPACDPVSYTITSANLAPIGGAVFVHWQAPAASGIFNGLDETTTLATITSATEIQGSTPLAELCGINGQSDVVVQLDFIQIEGADDFCITLQPPFDITFQAPTLGAVNIADVNFPLGTLGPLYVPNTLPSTPLADNVTLIKNTTSEGAVITGTGFAPVGGTALVTITDNLGGAIFDQSGTSSFTATGDIVDSMTISLPEIPLLTNANRLLADVPVEVRVDLVDGCCVFQDNFATLIAPPTIAPPQGISILNLESGVNQAGPGGAPVNTAGFQTLVAAGEFLSCLSQGIFINDEDTADNFDPASTVIFYIPGIGPNQGPINGRLGTGNPVPGANGDIGDEADANLGNALSVTAANITGQQRIAGANFSQWDTDDNGLVDVTIRVTNPNFQCDEAITTYRLRSPQVNRSDDAAFSNYNCDVTVDPTSVVDATPALEDFGVNGSASAATDTLDGLNIAMCFENDDTTDGISLFNGTELIVEFSRDGGVTWGRTIIDDALDGEDPDAFRSFPMVGYDAFGNLWLSYLIDDFTANDPLVDFSLIRLFVSFDQGATFVPALGDPILTGGAGSGGLIGRPGLAVGPSSTAGEQKALVAYTDARTAFPDEVSASEVRTPAYANAGSGGSLNISVENLIPPFGVVVRLHARPAIGPNGEAYVTWMELDFGTLSTDIFVDVDKDDIGAGGAVFDFGNDQLVAEDVFFNSAPPPSRPDLGTHIPLQDVECIRTGTNAGRLVVAFDSVTDPGPAAGTTLTQVVTTYSEDFGLTWSTPNAVASSAGEQFLPRLAADPVTGDIYVTWTDTTNDPANTATERFSARSTDGSDTWSSALLLSVNGASTAGAADGEFADYGLYGGCDAYAGCVVAVWPDNADNAGRMDAESMLYQQRAP